MVRYRFSRWDGTQSVFPTSEELVDHVADQILEGRDLKDVLHRMLQRGAELPEGRRMMGLQELMERLQQARESKLQRYDLSSMMDDIAERLERIIDTERQGIEGRLSELGDDGADQNDPSEETSEGGSPSGQNEGEQPLGNLLRRMGQKHLDELSGLPPEVGGRIKSLRDYDFMDPDARQQFEELLQMLQQQVLQNYFQGMQQSIQNMTPESLRETQQMVKDLNELVQRKLRGEDPDISEFMQKWGHFFPEGIETLDQLTDYMQRQMAQMESLLNSMPEDMRNELQDMMEGLLRDNRLRWDMLQLAANLQQLNPDGFPDNDFPFFGDEPITLQEALNVMGDLNSVEDLERQVRQAMRSNDAPDLDADEIGRLLGEEAQRFTEEMQRMTRALEEAGFIRRKGNTWELTPRAIRKIGDRALQDMFTKIGSDGTGDHNRDKSGVGIELEDTTKRYAFGDPFNLNTLKTVTNAVLREGAGTPVRIHPDDFEINEVIDATRCSTVIALDMSYSMLRYGAFQAGQRVGLALDTLIRTKYPKDYVAVFAFSYFVLPLKPSMLLDTYWVEYGGGTNFQEVLRQARQHLAKHGGTKQVILITDGEPTTYNYRSTNQQVDDFDADDPYEWLRRRRSNSVVQETLQEVVRCTRDNVTINTFMLDDSPPLVDFVRLMAKINKGRAFMSSPEHLGQYVVADYVTMRNSVIR